MKSESGCSDIYWQREPSGRKVGQAWEIQMEVQHRGEPGGDSVTMLSAAAAADRRGGVRLFKG